MHEPAFNVLNQKRGPAFNSWGGKREASFNSWGGKRAPAFNSWGGKRDPAFNSWGGKRDPAFNSWGGKRDPAFNSWGGKRDPGLDDWDEKRSSGFNSWGGKRDGAFSSWGGKRNDESSDLPKRSPKFSSWGGKREVDDDEKRSFSSWGGKRYVADNPKRSFSSWGGKRSMGIQTEEENHHDNFTSTKEVTGEEILADQEKEDDEQKEKEETFTGYVKAQDNKVILPAIKSEVDRNIAKLKIDKLQAPFFISYAITDYKYLDISASLGTLLRSSEYARRTGYPNLLVGSYERNNMGYVTLDDIYIGTYPESVCLENDAVGIATSIWRDLDRQYKTAAENYEAKQGIIRQQNLKEEDLNLSDFEKKDVINIIQNPSGTAIDKAYWEDYVKKASELLKKYPDIISSEVVLSVREGMVYYHNTEGSRYAIPSPYYKLNLRLSTMTTDGQELSDDLFFEHSSFTQMPAFEEFVLQCEGFISYFITLRNAPLIEEAYSGPILIEKMALAEAFQNHFFSQSLIAKKKAIYPEDVERYARDHPLVSTNSLEMMLNKKVTSRSLTIKSLSGTELYDGKKLDGYYPVDAEGVVPDKELVLVENGVLKNMLNGRIPTKKFRNSNGHARFDENNLSNKVVPGNVMLLSNQTFSGDELKAKLIEAAKEEDLDYAYVVRRLRGNNIIAIYRLYVQDGREELVRGASLPDFNMKSFKRVLGASDRNFMYNTTSFGPLTTYIVPEGLLFEELEVTRDANLSLKTSYTVPKPTAEMNR